MNSKATRLLASLKLRRSGPARQVKIGFDLDGVFINRPPLVPKSVIEWLYKRKGNGLSYRFPGKLEQKIRILSHAAILRPPIRDNLNSLRKANKNDSLLVSSRFSFLKERTFEWDKKNDLFKYFKKSYFNEKDEQPHKFKGKIIKKEKIKKYIDDDLDLLLFLSRENPGIEFYWVGGHVMKLPKNITHIKDLEEFFEKYV